MSKPRPTDLAWTKASKSGGLGACVELATCGEVILLRDSKNPDFHLSYTRTEIDAFLDGAKKGEFDHLINGG